MAQSRLEKIGTIFSRVSGLLRSGAMKPEDKPIWYDVYEAFPPKLEPKYDRPAPSTPIRNIFYEEDVIRAKYHKSVQQIESVNLLNTKQETSAQQFIQIYNGLREQGAMDSEQIFTTVKELLNEKRQHKEENITEVLFHEAETQPKSTLLNSFKEAQAERKNVDKTRDKKSSGVNIESLFKE